MDYAASESHCSELVARERSGHTAVVEDNLLYVWGGYVSVADNEVFLSNNQIWVYDLQQGVWEVFHMTGEVPPPMSGSCGCSLNGHLYIFGGCDVNGQTNQIYCVNLTDGNYTWRKIIPERGCAPSPRDKVSCWIHEGRLIYFGGYGHKLLADIDHRNRSFIVDEAAWVEDVYWGWNNEVHIFDPVQASWSEPQTHGHSPAPRAAHASATTGCRGYIFGGRVMETRKSDIHCLNLETWTWSEIVPVSSSPVGRSWHSLTAVSDRTLFLFGGLSSDCKPMSCGTRRVSGKTLTLLCLVEVVTTSFLSTQVTAMMHSFFRCNHIPCSGFVKISLQRTRGTMSCSETSFPCCRPNYSQLYRGGWLSTDLPRSKHNHEMPRTFSYHGFFLLLF